MCGIAGIANLRPAQPPPREALLQMVGALSHRGPDAAGLYRDDHVGLAHTRLSIIDIEGGNQPLSSADGSVWVSFNGEIFNHPELKNELESLGYRFRTRSDTEVFATAYAAWGEAALTRLNGQFAAALWHPRKRALALARDRLGIRPLYYAEQGGRLYFASEVKALLAAEPALSTELDPRGIDDVFTFWAPLSPRTAFSAVREVEPGHVHGYGPSGAWGRAYWIPSYGEEEVRGGVSESAERVSAALEDATKLRMLRADVPVGSYLSGGLDSSLVAALGSRARGEPIETFSVRFEDADLDETAYQRQMARRLGSRHHELAVTARDVASVFPDVIRHAERPILRTAPAPLYMLSEFVRAAGIKVVLTGEGADEMFAGYDLFREGAVRRFWARAPASAHRSGLLERLYPYLRRSPVANQQMARQFFGQNLHRWREPGFAHGPRWSATAALKRILSSEVRAEIGDRDATDALFATLPPAFESWSHLAQDQYIEARTLLSGYLLSSQGDRMLMAHGVEGRFPFLDRDLVELANRLPDSHKLRGLDEKHVLKRVASKHVPAGIARRKKQPYRAPDAAALAGDGAPDWIPELLSDGAVRSVGVLAPEPVRRLWQKCAGARGLGMSNSDNMALVGAISIQLLHYQVARSRGGQPEPRRLSVDIDHVTS